MQRNLLTKTLMVIGLTLIIYIPLVMIQSTISERIWFRNEAVKSIATDSVSQQTVVGPVLVIPYTDEYEETEDIGDVKNPKTRTVQRKLQKRLMVFPHDLKIKGSIETDHRYRGIHKVLVYSGQLALAGDFSLPDESALSREKPQSRITLSAPFIALSVEDVRGIRNIPAVAWGGKKYEFQQGSGLPAFKNGLHAVLGPIELKEKTIVPFPSTSDLTGSSVSSSLRLQKIMKSRLPQNGRTRNSADVSCHLSRRAQ
jgi:inner membrane protein